MTKLVLVILMAISVCCKAAELIPITPIATKQLPVGRIVNGNLATANQFPWQVAVQSGLSNATTLSRCSGAILSSNRVLTAAHCTYDYQIFHVGFGSNNIDTPQVLQMIDRANVIVHPGFSAITLNNDISIIRLNSDVIFGTTIQAIRLPRRAQSILNYFAGQQGQIAGWGRISDSNTTLATNLRYATISLFSVDICRSYYGASIVTDSTLCGVGVPDSRSSPCGGDSGAPLAWRDPSDTIWSIIGVFSFVSQNGCASGSPSGYSNIATHLDWISQNTGIIIRN